MSFARTVFRARAAGGIAMCAAVIALAGPLACSGSSCPSGQMQICRTSGDCRCGPPCNTQMDCSGTNACIRFAGAPTDPGVCVDALWAFGSQPPCVPLCRENQTCVQWGDRPNSCADSCTTNQSCPSGCCLVLSDGTHVCAPSNTYCTNSCNPPCTTGQICILLNQPLCTTRCATDADCDRCCLPLQGGGGACSPNGVDCPTSQPDAGGPCNVVDACAPVQSTFRAPPDNACGSVGSYDAMIRNACGQPIVCLVCWWSPTTHAYSNCNVLDQIPSNAAVATGGAQCADVMFPDPPLRTRCIDLPSYQSGFDCLGSGPL
jgi:hypothetical protein